MTIIKVVMRSEPMKKETIYGNIATIMDLKKRICERNPNSVILSFKGKFLNDATPISALGEEIEFVIEKEIEFSKIAVREITPDKKEDRTSNPLEDDSLDNIAHKYEKKYNSTEEIGDSGQIRIILNGESTLINREEIFYKNGKPFLITKKVKKFNLKDFIDLVRNNISRTQIVQIAILSFIVATKNYPLLSMIVTVNLLKSISLLIIKYKVDENFTNHILYSIFMFFVSAIAIDHEKITRKLKSTGK